MSIGRWADKKAVVYIHHGIFSSVQFSSVTQSCLTLCNPMDCSMPAFPFHHQLLEPTQTYVHWDGDAIQPSHPLSPLLLLPSIPPCIRVFSNSQLFAWCGQSIGVSVLSFSNSPFNEHPGLISFRMDWLNLLSVQGTLKKTNTTVQKHQFFGAQLSSQSNSHTHTWLLENP